MDRVDLSADTWIENGELHTTSSEKAAPWMNIEGLETKTHDKTFGDDGHSWAVIHEYYIPLTVVASVYAYAEGEPWAMDEDHIILCGLPFWDWDDIRGEKVLTDPLPEYYTCRLHHRRMAGVCDTGEQFRALHTALMEVEGESGRH